jgi:hypothetical protein
MVSLVALISLASPGLIRADRLTVTEPAVRLPVLLGNISSQTGLTLTSDPNLRNEVLLIRVRQVPVEELLRRIGAVTKGRWIGEGTRRRLEIDPTVMASEVRRNRLALEKNLRSLFGVLGERLRASPAEEEGEDDGGARLVWRAVYEQGAIATLNSADRKTVVLAENPSRYQSTWRPSNRLRRQLAQYGQGVKALQESGPFAWRFRYLLWYRQEDPVPTVIASLLAVSPAGRILHEETAWIGEEEFSYSIVGVERTVASKAFFDSFTGVPPLARPELTQIRSFFTMDSRSWPGDSQLRAKVFDPFTWEPLRWIVGETLAASLEGLSWQVVAALPDDAGRVYQAEPEKPKVLWDQLNLIAEIQQDKDWVTVRPLHGSRDGSHRADRASMRDVYQIAMKYGFVGRLDHAEKLGNFNSHFLSVLHFNAGFDPHEEDRAFGRIMTAANPDDLAQLRRGSTVFLGQLSPQMQENIREAILDGGSHILPPEATIPPMPPYRAYAARTLRPQDGLQRWSRDFGDPFEPTDLLQGGYGDVTVRWDVQRETVLIPVNDDGSPIRTDVFLSLLDAAPLAIPTTVGSEQGSGQASQSVRIGQADVIQMVITFAGGYRYIIRTDDLRSLDQSRVYRLGALPTAIAERVAEYGRKIRNPEGQSEFSSFGG